MVILRNPIRPNHTNVRIICRYRTTNADSADSSGKVRDVTPGRSHLFDEQGPRNRYSIVNLCTNGRQSPAQYSVLDPFCNEYSCTDRPGWPRLFLEDPCVNDRAMVQRTEQDIPDIVIRRLPLYVRTLRWLQDGGIDSVSSDQLAELIGVTAAQIRRDLSYFGKFGKQGKGYDTLHLEQTIAEILQIDREWPVALVGFGNLGAAVARYRGFGPSSFRITAIFDRNPQITGRVIDGVTVQSDHCITSEIARLGIQIGIIAVPTADAQEVADAMVAGGVQALLNYAPVVIKTPPHVQVREIDPIGALQSMTYYLDGAEMGNRK